MPEKGSDELAREADPAFEDTIEETLDEGLDPDVPDLSGFDEGERSQLEDEPSQFEEG